MRAPVPPSSAALLAFVLILPAASARAAGADCTGFAPLKDGPAATLARVTGPGPRINFLRGGSEKTGCPADTGACRARAFVVPGDLVVLSATAGAYVCADFKGPKGAGTTGWLPAAAVSQEAAKPVAAADWTGTWAQVEATIRIAASGKSGELQLKGDATYGALDPDRVRRGAVNVGEFEARRAPSGDALSFTVGDKDTLPVDKGDADGCKVWLRRLGPYLLADDNNACGGLNVSFRGLYTRQR